MMDLPHVAKKLGFLLSLCLSLCVSSVIDWCLVQRVP